LTAPKRQLGRKYPVLAPMFLFWFCAAVVILAGYAVAWQLILERLPLTTAYLRKGISYMLIFVWAVVIFHEAITVKQVVGILVIIIGMVVSMSDEQ
ncbi:MAG: EamA family transporter, partial [Clostridiales bacterium]|nr:EamA family transporter [Clostridiales bacterium]